MSNVSPRISAVLLAAKTSVVIILCILSITSCARSQYKAHMKGYGDRLLEFESWAEAAGDEGSRLKQQVEILLSTMESVELPMPVKPLKYLKNTTDGLGWQVWKPGEDDGNPWDPDVAPYWNPDSLTEALKAASDAPIETNVLPVHYFPDELAGPSPLGDFATKWSDSELTLWLVREGVCNLDSRYRPEDTNLEEFWIHKAAETVLIELKGPGSLELEQFRTGNRDEVTWSILVSDLCNQLRPLWKGSGQDMEAYEQSRTRLYNAWLADFRAQYPDRFITNRRRDFGEPMLNDLELASLDLSKAGWTEYEKIWLDLGAEFKAFTDYVFPDGFSGT